mmetsp:Transcript_6943/g.13869  ORF Transcript_6943/g.13869 Transcript_6943/m.13869 type:complete len:402 (+) Transcript_6943:547-1752(+)|eukprot:CAMPEP_0171540752 /NCGR_PEP_ID=MMETSP0960-20121227/1380_1 /TAXON_ID=87120 /ORGANISM="Aurantiochytrium limacinum, Strain ATCCMYA-1381" /LENGTH=401 /DNA_ID=CAMNT_0012088005 /DNA_START=473 /DNA_END=1678 /DNA_ORIENTATION=-
MSEQFAHQVLRIAVAQICKSKEFGDFDGAAEGHAFDTFVDVIGKYIEKIGRLCRTYAEHDGRTESNLLDLLQSFDRLEPNRVDWRDLERMCREVPWQVPYTTGIPAFPVDKRPRRAQQYGEKRKAPAISSTAANLLASAKRQKTGESGDGDADKGKDGSKSEDGTGNAKASSAQNDGKSATNAATKTSVDSSTTSVDAKAKDAATANGTTATEGTDGAATSSSGDKSNAMDVDDGKGAQNATTSGATDKDKDKKNDSDKDKKTKDTNKPHVPRQEDTLERPLYVPGHYPSFPERYTYSYTYVDATKRESDPKAILDRNLKDKRRVQEALVRISQGSGAASKPDRAFGEPMDDLRGSAAARNALATPASSSNLSLSNSAGSKTKESSSHNETTLPSLPGAFS